MEQYNLKLSEKELRKLQIFITMYAHKLLENAETYRKEAEKTTEYRNETIRIFTSNSIWYEECFEAIKEIGNRIDKIPF